MRPALAASVILLALAAGGQAVAQGPPGTLKRPALLFGYEAGTVLRGSGFVAGERISVLARVGDARATGVVTAGKLGGFVWHVRLPSLRCTEAFARAHGNRGSVATYSRAAPSCRNP